MSRRAFLEFDSNVELVKNKSPQVSDLISIAEASRLLSGILFLNAWPDKLESSENRAPSWFYANPRATHPIDIDNFQSDLRMANVHGLKIDDFKFDNY